MRPLSESEINVVKGVAERLLPPYSQRLLDDLAIASTTSPDTGASIVQFVLAGYERPAYEGQHSYGVEGRVNDQDGSELMFVLHADANGRLLELELVRFDEGDVVAPNWSTLRFW